MPKSDDKASEKEPDALQSDFVYDFLYCDSRRIASFLAQFDNSGHLEKVIQRESASKGAKSGFEMTVGGGAMLAGTGGSGNLGFKRNPHEEGSESSERIYDPLWANALTFLDFLASGDLVASDLARSGIGRFVKVTGSLKVIDLSIIKRIIENPTLKKKLLSLSAPESGNRQERRRQERDMSTSATDHEAGMALTTIFAMTAQAVILDSDGNNSVWCNLRDEALVVTTADLLLQHGIEIAGEWTMIGILDAKPGGNTGTAAADDHGSAFVNAIASLTPIVRNVLGRPTSSYGVTPLLILRTISD